MPQATRPVSEHDIEAYSAYRRKLAAITTSGDPPPHCFSAWFQSRYHALPLDALVSDCTSAAVVLPGHCRLPAAAATRVAT